MNSSNGMSLMECWPPWELQVDVVWQFVLELFKVAQEIEKALQQDFSLYIDQHMGGC